MKKSLIPLAAISVVSAASAQSSLVVFGVVDTAISGYSNRSTDLRSPSLQNPLLINQGSVRLSENRLGHSGYNTARLGFRGTEDLGGGLAASFWLESPITPDDGATALSAFSRRSTLSLSGGFGELRLGRDYVPTFWNNSVFDPFGVVGVGTNLIQTASAFNFAGGTGGFGGDPNQARASNSVGYFLRPDLGGFYGQLMYSFHEQTKYSPGGTTPPGLNALGILNPGAVASSRAGRYVGGRFGYANGPLDIAFAYSKSTTADSFYAGTTNFVKTANLGASYNFGFLKLFGEVSRLKSERDYAIAPIGGGVPDVDLTGYLVGVTAPVGAGLIRAAYSHIKYDRNLTPSPFALPVADPKAGKIALGYVHNLSKRTALYATVARVSNKNGAALTLGGPAFLNSPVFSPKSSTGYDFGIRHAF